MPWVGLAVDGWLLRRSSRLDTVVATVPDAISISLWLTVGLLSNVTVFLVSGRLLASVARVGTMNEPLGVSPDVCTVRGVWLLSVSNAKAGDESRSARLVAVVVGSLWSAGVTEVV